MNNIIIITFINSKNELEKLLNNNNFNILWFSANWCKPCKQLDIILNNLINNYIIEQKQLKIYKIDVDKIELDFIINKLPTLIILDDKFKELKRIEGINEIEIKSFIESLGKLKIIETEDF